MASHTLGAPSSTISCADPAFRSSAAKLARCFALARRRRCESAGRARPRRRTFVQCDAFAARSPPAARGTALLAQCAAAASRTSAVEQHAGDGRAERVDRRTSQVGRPVAKRRYRCWRGAARERCGCQACGPRRASCRRGRGLPRLAVRAEGGSSSHALGRASSEIVSGFSQLKIGHAAMRQKADESTREAAHAPSHFSCCRTPAVPHLHVQGRTAHRRSRHGRRVAQYAHERRGTGWPCKKISLWAPRGGEAGRETRQQGGCSEVGCGFHSAASEAITEQARRPGRSAWPTQPTRRGASKLRAEFHMAQQIPLTFSEVLNLEPERVGQCHQVRRSATRVMRNMFRIFT